jgi:predicted transcriptional regulator
MGPRSSSVLLPDLSEIKKMRTKLGISQRKLSSYVGISQSTITKIENRRIRPSYELVGRIFGFLESFEGNGIGLVGDVQVSPVVFVDKSEKLLRATTLMQQNGFKQLPVLDGYLVVGAISERSVSRQILKVKENPSELLNRPVSVFMEEPFPTVSEFTPLTAVIPLLQHSQAVLTTRHGKIYGIVTNADLVKIVSKTEIARSLEDVRERTLIH